MKDAEWDSDAKSSNWWEAVALQRPTGHPHRPLKITESALPGERTPHIPLSPTVVLEPKATPAQMKSPTPPWLRPGAWHQAPKGVALEGGPEAPDDTPIAVPSRRVERLNLRQNTQTLVEELLPVLRGLERSWNLAQSLVDQIHDRHQKEHNTITDRVGRPCPDCEKLELQKHDMMAQTMGNLWARTRDILQYHGLTLINPLGEPFDPSRCIPVKAIPTPGKKNGEIIEVLARGYSLGEDVIAKAEVAIAWSR